MRYLDPENVDRHRSGQNGSHNSTSNFNAKNDRRQPYVPRQQQQQQRPSPHLGALNYDGQGSSSRAERNRSRSPVRDRSGIDGDWRAAREVQRTRVEGVKMVAEKGEVGRDGEGGNRREREVRRGEREGRSDSEDSEMMIDEDR